jgi:Phage Mu protein F like protein
VADRLGSIFDAIAERMLDDLARALKDKDTAPHVVHLILDHLPTLLHEAAIAGFTGIAQTAYSHASDVLLQTLPESYLRAASPVPVEVAKLEADIEPVISRLSAAAKKLLFRKVLFPPLGLNKIRELLRPFINPLTWVGVATARGEARPSTLAALVATEMSAGKTPQEVKARLQPFMGNVAYRARRLARTYGMTVAGKAQEAAHRQLGPLLIGYQIHATLDQHTRSKHAARNGRVYYLHPNAGEYGVAEMPHPPIEEDGHTIAWNCRCWTSPVLRPPANQDANRLAIFTNAADKLIPDPTVYSQWFDQAGERKRRMAVGTRRYGVVSDLLGRTPRWEDFLEPTSGDLLTLDELKDESPDERAARVAAVRVVIAERNDLLRRMATFGWLGPEV